MPRWGPTNAARWLAQVVRAREHLDGDPALDRTLGWIRSIALEDDAFVLATTRARGVFRYPFPSEPRARPTPVAWREDDPRVRFVVHAGPAARDAEEPPGWRAILRFDALRVIERDAPHGGLRPLRLGLTEKEGRALLSAARAGAERVVAGGISAEARLSSRSGVAVAIWTRGRLRGSVVCPPGRALPMARKAGEWACQDARFERLSSADLADTVFEVGLIHAPALPLSPREIRERDAYPDKALFVSEGPRFGAYMPEVWNVRAHRKLAPLLDTLAREKAGLDGVGAGTRIEACEVSDFVESADRSRAVALRGPVARVAPAESFEQAARAAGHAACAWLAAVQEEDGAWPVRVRPSTGQGEGSDVVRVALTAYALAAYGVAEGLDGAAVAARRALASVERTRPSWTQDPTRAVWVHCYRGRAARCLGDDSSFAAAAAAVGELAPRATLDRLASLHAASFSLEAAPRDTDAARRAHALGAALYDEFRAAARGTAPMSLAEWAELAMAFPADAPEAREIVRWLRVRELPDGSFPDTTRSRYAYTRGTGKIFEVLARAEETSALERSLGWLREMQYRPDSVFFVPAEHRARVLGGLRHDAYDTDAWIDAAGHLLIGLARLAGRPS